MHPTPFKQHRNRASLKTLAVVLLFVAAQILGIFHLVEHSIEGDNDGCEICAAVAHAGAFTLPEPVQLLLPAVSFGHVADTEISPLYAATLVVYTSRAPPALS